MEDLFLLWYNFLNATNFLQKTTKRWWLATSRNYKILVKGRKIMNNNFSENLKKIRKEHNLSQEQLANELGVSRQAISKWESAVAYPEMDKIIALCDKFNLNIDDLLHRDIKEIKGEEESKKKLNKIIDDFLKFITDTVNLFSNMTFKSKTKCLLEQLIITIILFCISLIIVQFGRMVFKNLLGFLPINANNFITNIVTFIFIIFCFVSSVIILTHIFKTRYLDYYTKIKNDVNNVVDKEQINLDNNVTKEEFNNKNKILFKKNEDKIIIRDPKHSEYKFINGLFKCVIGFIKFFVLCFSLFFAFLLICFVCLFIISFLLIKNGLLFIGLISIIVASSVINIIILLIIFNFVFNRKSDKKKLIWSFLISLILLGIGSGMIFIATLNFEIVDVNETMVKTDTIELEMHDNTFFNTYHSITYMEEDISNIRVEYKINKYCHLDEIISNQEGIHLWTYCQDPIKLVREFIDNINHKKIVTINSDAYDIVVYTSKENIEKLENNRHKYFDEQRYYDNNINFYENRINELERELEEYKNKVWMLEEQLIINNE